MSISHSLKGAVRGLQLYRNFPIPHVSRSISRVGKHNFILVCLPRDKFCIQYLNAIIFPIFWISTSAFCLLSYPNSPSNSFPRSFSCLPTFMQSCLRILKIYHLIVGEKLQIIPRIPALSWAGPTKSVGLGIVSRHIVLVLLSVNIYQRCSDILSTLHCH